MRTEPCSRAARETWRVGIARRATQQNCFGNGHRPRKRDDEKKHFNDKLLRTEIVLGSAEKTVHAKSIHHSTKMRSETPRSTTGTPSSGPADRNAHRCDKHTRRAQASTDHTDKSSTLGVEKMRTRKYSPSNEDAFRNTMLYYWYLLQVVWQRAGHTIVVCARGPSRCRQTTPTTPTRWGSASVVQPAFDPILRQVKNRNDSTFAADAFHLDEACQTLLPCRVLVLFSCLYHCLFLLLGSVGSGLWLRLRHGRRLRTKHVELWQLRRN